MAKRLAVIDGVEVESMHTAKSYWKTGTGGDNIELPKSIQFTTRQAERLLTGLEKKGLLVRKGSDKGAYWAVVS